MMKIKRICIFFFLSILSFTAYAGELNEFELVDGSTIYGQIVSFNDGIYIVESSSLGTIKINESDIQQIRVKSGSTKRMDYSSPANSTITSEIQALQTLIKNDQEIMNMILSLQNDPDFQEIMRDPNIVNALNSGDIAALISNPKFISLLNNQKVQEIQKKLTR